MVPPPFLRRLSLWLALAAAISILVSIAVSFANAGPAANATLTSDLLRSPADAGRAFAFLVLGGNVFGLVAPIATGYLVAASGSFASAFLAAGLLALFGMAVTLVLSRGTIGEAPVAGRAFAAPG